VSRRPLVRLLLAAASAAGAVLVWLAAFHVAAGRTLDGRALESFAGAARPPLTPSIEGVAGLADPLPFALWTVGIAAVALLRGRWLMATAVAAILLSANVVTHMLKPALADPRGFELQGIQTHYPGSWPSGHSTAAMSLALCLVLVAGPRMRPLAAFLGAGFAIAMGYSLVVLGYHLPSDVLGGFLVAATFTLLGAAALAALESRAPARAPIRDRPPAMLSAPALAAAAAGLFAALAVAVLWRAPGAPADVLEHPVAVLAGLSIAALGLALTTGLALLLRR
jgi:membrane-associated phospholipid phosphatase